MYKVKFEWFIDFVKCIDGSARHASERAVLTPELGFYFALTPLHFEVQLVCFILHRDLIGNADVWALCVPVLFHEGMDTFVLFLCYDNYMRVLQQLKMI